MKPIKCEVHEPCDGGGIKITYHTSIRKAKKYCKANGLPNECIYPKEFSVWFYGKPAQGRCWAIPKGVNVSDLNIRI